MIKLNQHIIQVPLLINQTLIIQVLFIIDEFQIHPILFHKNKTVIQNIKNNYVYLLGDVTSVHQHASLS